ncbi:MAG: SPFH domain-containing protein, partial [Clostridia bacterium]|nr:SPFH domain-containing protein [Clostridia bacterium]
MAIIDVIKYEGDNSTFVWKHPGEDFSTKSQLIVHESQEAIFFKDGKALDAFSAGKYTLSTGNIPILSKLINIPFGGDSPFHCEVYFINKTEQMAIRWGTDSKVQYIEPTYKFPISIGASGEMTLSVEDSKQLLLKLVGTEHYFDRQKLIMYFRGVLMTKVKTYMAQTMRQNAISI